MARRFGLWVGAGAMWLISACAGDPFVLADASADSQSSTPPPDSGSGPEAAVSDAPSDAHPLNTSFSCANQSCTLPQICCTSVSSPTGSNCTEGSCSPCSTELDCASDSNCPGSQACCISQRATSTNSCNPPAFIAHCSTAVCPGGSSRLCDPNGPIPRCPLGRTCSTDSGDLQNVGLPQGFGVCK